MVTKRRPTEEINVNNKKNKTVSRFYDHLCSVVDHCHRNQTWFGGRPEGNDNGNYPVIAKNLSQHQIHCFCVCVCVCIFVCVCVRKRKSSGRPEGKKRESCLLLDYIDDGKEGEDRNTRRKLLLLDPLT